MLEWSYRFSSESQEIDLSHYNIRRNASCYVHTYLYYNIYIFIYIYSVYLWRTLYKILYKYINTWLKKNKYIKLKKRHNVKYIILLLILYFNIYIYISCQVYNRRVRKISVVSLPRPSLVNAASSLYLDQTGDCFFYILLAHTSDKIGIDKYLYTKEGIEKKTVNSWKNCTIRFFDKKRKRKIWEN